MSSSVSSGDIPSDDNMMNGEEKHRSPPQQHTESPEEAPKREIKLLETVEDIQNRREQVLRRYADFKVATQLRRKKLEDAKKLCQFKRDADEIEVWIKEKLQTTEDENYLDPLNLQVRKVVQELLILATMAK